MLLNFLDSNNRINNQCIDPLNLIEGGYTPLLLNRDTGKNYKTSSQSKGGNGNVNLRGRRHYRNRRLATSSSQNDGKSSGKSSYSVSNLSNPLQAPVSTRIHASEFLDLYSRRKYA